MIRIDEKTKEIVFSAPGLDTLRFPLVSGYVCPDCKEVLKAAFLTEEAIGVRWYLDTLSAKAAQERYTTRHTAGVQVLLLSDKARRQVKAQRQIGCAFRAYTDSPLRENLQQLLDEEACFRVSLTDIDPSRVKERPGLVIVRDLMGCDEPVVVFDPTLFAGGPKKPEESAGDFARRQSAAQELLVSACGYHPSPARTVLSGRREW